MYLLYIDDSGTCELKKDDTYCLTGGNSRYFVLGAILIKASTLNELEQIVCNDFKRKCLKSEFSEIKFSIKGDNLNCRNTCNDKPNKNCFKHKVANLIHNTDCTVFSCAQDKYETTVDKIVTNKEDIYQLSFQHLLKLVDTYMYNNKIKEDIIVFIDKKDTGTSKDELIYKAYKKAINNHTIYKAFANTLFSPSINIVYSQYTLGAQLADFVAGCTWSFVESLDNKETAAKAKELSSIISNRVYKNEFKVVFGYGYTKCRDWLK